IQSHSETAARPTPQQLLARIYRERQVVDPAGKAHPLHSEITPDEGQLIASLIERYDFTRTLEIGCAFGLSSLHICGALTARPSGFHTIIDPGQHAEWQGIGIHHIEQCGFRSY